MRLAVALLTVLGLCALLAAADGPTEEPIDLLADGLDGFEYFLVDEDLEMADVWSIQNDTLICKGDPPGYLCTKTEYEDFRLTFEWRWPDEPTNSGALLRIIGEPELLPKCIEAQLQHENAGDLYSFQGFVIDGDPDRKFENPDAAGGLIGVRKIEGNENDPGEWNKYEILVEGDTVTLSVNGKKVNQATGCDVCPGKIGFQSEGSPIHFRNMKVTPIP